MARTLKNYYDDMLNELYQEHVDALPFRCGTAAALMEEHDPTMYRCGFADWTDGLECRCEECGEEIRVEKLENMDMDDEVLCEICDGTHHKCPDCDEILDGPSQDDEDLDCCASCREDRREREEEAKEDREDDHDG